MNFNKHYDIVGLHAFLSASKYHWTNYDDEKMDLAFTKYMAIQRGTELHDLACRLIRLKVKLPKSKLSLNNYVNDAIGYGMKPEQPLFYSSNAFGTADTISFRNKILRIHDLKTGESRVSITQLMVYSSLFCLEYKVDPRSISTELRIYQSDEVLVHTPEPEDIHQIMEKIIRFDKRIEQRKSEMED